ncbi:MAG: radical SAM family heme chaperone HemW, partial [Brooklawnia sp.]
MGHEPDSPSEKVLRERLALAPAEGTPMGCYLHVPFCTVRCGYCDFNTYVAKHIGPNAEGDFLTAAHREIDLAANASAGSAQPLATVFFGGGTPTLMSPVQLGELLAHLSDSFGLAPGAEITTEANPETLGEPELAGLRAAGINRLSLGMQSASPAVLATLDRQHTPGRALQVVRQAHAAGFEQVSLDLIYGTPGESLADWRGSLEAAVGASPQHISAYALVIEPGTAMGRRLASGQIARPDADLQADMYLLAEEVLTAAGFHNYEVSNWADAPTHRARHNLGYWAGHDWWGIGPGAHSHIQGIRWWNV